MTFLDVVTPGDKIDIHVVQTQNGNEFEKTGTKLYKSNVMDLISNVEIEIAMPTDGAKMVLFQTGLRIEMTFYSKRGLYRCHGIVQRRYKKDNLFMLLVSERTELKKFQRREYFRINCIIDVDYYAISKEIAAAGSTGDLITASQNVEIQCTMQRGTLLDISGGGIRFSSLTKIEKDSFILTDFHLENDRVNSEFFLACQIISSERSTKEPDKYVNRAKFIYKDLKDREAIVQFVFEEERRIRRKEIG